MERADDARVAFPLFHGYYRNMNTETGRIEEWDEVQKLQAEEIKKWIPIERDLTAKEKCEKQIELYSPCGCGSGKKFKFCCHQKNQRFTITEIASVIPWARAYHMGDCNVLVAKEPIKIRGIEREMWHLSIAHPHRYPTWEEITFSRYRFLPDEAQMAMLLPPKRDYVNIHANCFHLYEIDEIFEKQPNNENLDSNHTA
jgi:hypothetical protein